MYLFKVCLFQEGQQHWYNKVDYHKIIEIFKEYTSFIISLITTSIWLQ